MSFFIMMTSHVNKCTAFSIQAGTALVDRAKGVHSVKLHKVIAFRRRVIVEALILSPSEVVEQLWINA